MKKILGIIGCLLLLSGEINLVSAGDNCNRRCLIKLMDSYLEAVSRHEHSSLPLADDVKFVENTQKTAIGDGLWKTATAGPKDFKIYAADSVAGQVGFIGKIHVNGEPALLGARLKLVDGKITEIDHLVIPKTREPIAKNFKEPRAGLVRPLGPDERTSREQMLKIANSYYDSIVNVNGALAPFARECQRRENGVITANAFNQTPEEAARDDFSVFRKMGCSDQISSGVWSNITAISKRRLIAADEEMGLVFAFSILEHDGSPEVMKIVGVPGIEEYKNEYGPFDTVAAHMFKIRNGKIYEVEAVGFMDRHGIENGWE